MDYSKIVTKIKPSIGKVIIFNSISKKIEGNGSGFVFGEPGILVTCNHVVSDKNLIFIRFPDSEDFIDAKIAIRDEEHDLALLKFKDDNREPLKLGDGVVKEGMEVLFSGYPLGVGELITHQGILSSISKDATGVVTYLIDGTVNPGNSGCPLMEKDGRVIGVVNAQRREGRNILDKVEEMTSGAISLHGIDLVEIYKAIMSNLQLGIGYAIPASYIPEHKELLEKSSTKIKKN